MFIRILKGYLCLSVIFASLSNVCVGQVKLIEKITPDGKGLIIPYEKYQLPNGLTILFHEDHSDPIVYVDVTYHVGSAREEQGKSGFAHFFEHMMFQGSDHVADDEHFKIVTESGGSLNGTTNRDRTNYFETLPSNQLETALWLESDRMGFLLDAVTKEKFENQRETVKNERGQNYDNRPYGLASQYINQTLYPFGHPYSWLTIGYIEDLNKVGVQDLKNFFLRWYGPNNATLTLSGDFETSSALKLIEKYFGSIKSCPEVKAAEKTIFTLETNRFGYYEDNVQAPQLQVVFPAVPSGHEDETAFDFLMAALGKGKNSYLYKYFVKPQFTSSANAYMSSSELAGEATFTFRGMPDQQIGKVADSLWSVLKIFDKEFITEEDLERIRTNEIKQFYNSLESVQGKGSLLAYGQTLFNDPNLIPKREESIKKVTLKDIRRVFETYIKGKGAVVFCVVPKGKSSLAVSTEKFRATPKPADPGVKKSENFESIAYVKPKDSFDRSKRPEAQAPKTVKVPEYWESVLPNGLKIIGTKNAEMPLVSLTLTIKAGKLFSGVDSTKAGIQQLCAQMFMEGAGSLTGEQLAAKLEKLGTSITVSSDNRYTVFSLSCLSENMQPSLDILNSVLLSPTFPQDAFNRVKMQLINGLKSQMSDAQTISSRVFDKLIYPDNALRGVNPTAESYGAITRDDLLEYYKKRIIPNEAVLALSGNADKATVLKATEFLNTWKKGSAPSKLDTKGRTIDKTTVYFVHKDNSPQSYYRIGSQSIPYDATGDYFKCRLMNFPLGEAFNSRLNYSMREVKGYTYGLRASFTGSEEPGPFAIATGVKSNATDSSLVEIMSQIKMYLDSGPTAAEVEFTKKSLLQSEALEYETNAQKTGFLREIAIYNLTPDFKSKQAKIIAAQTQASMKEQAVKFINPDKLNIVVVGDRKHLPALSKLGYKIVELNPEGYYISTVAP